MIKVLVALPEYDSIELVFSLYITQLLFEYESDGARCIFIHGVTWLFYFFFLSALMVFTTNALLLWSCSLYTASCHLQFRPDICCRCWIVLAWVWVMALINRFIVPRIDCSGGSRQSLSSRFVILGIRALRQYENRMRLFVWLDCRHDEQSNR